jgi:acetoin utilization deacetylase AcuC-like enzyme
MSVGHPEQPARLGAIEDQLRVRGLDAFLVHHEAPRASDEQIARVHPQSFIDELRGRSPARGVVALDPDTMMCPGTLEAALRAAGANVLATDLVIAGAAKRAFCNVRPPGHHAERQRAMGFCFFDNVAVGAAHALDVHGLDRVAILDFDVHFGNGTADIFKNDRRVLLCSTYEYPLYPGLNPPTIPHRSINCPLPAGSDGAAFRQAVTDYWLPALESFAPQMIFVSAGFDAHARDPLADLRLSVDDYSWITEMICAVAARHSRNRIVSTLEGGYDLPTLATCAAAHIEKLLSA